MTSKGSLIVLLGAAIAALASSCGCPAIGCGPALSLALPLPVSLERAAQSRLTLCHRDECQTSGFLVTSTSEAGPAPATLSTGVAATTALPRSWAGIAREGQGGRPVLALSWTGHGVQVGDRYRLVLAEPDGKEMVLFDEPVTFQRAHPLDMECAPTCPSAQIDRVQ
jgi:hypothetical protein